MLVGELARRADVKAQTIRYYESLGLLTRPVRSGAGYRRYADDAVAELRFIRNGQNLGFSLDEVKRFWKLRVRAMRPAHEFWLLPKDTFSTSRSGFNNSPSCAGNLPERSRVGRTVAYQHVVHQLSVA